MKSKTEDGRITMFGDVYDNNGTAVLAVLELFPKDKNGYFLNLIKVASAYGKDTNPQRLIDTSKILYVDNNIKRIHNWLSVNRLQLPLPSSNYGFLDTNISQNNTFVNNYSMQNSENDTKFSDRDSKGIKLSKGQQEFFKDSKVRDAEGNLLKVFHGSPESFTVFNTHKDTSSIIYYASFFTSDEKKATAYADKNNTDGKIYKAYLNISNPVIPLKFMEQIKSIPYEVKKRLSKEFDVEAEAKKSNYILLNFAKFVARKDNSTMATVLKGWGFDGYANYRDYAVFEPNQIKSVDNLTPTSNSDIRFSMRDTVEETKDLIAVHNLSEEKLLKALQLGGLPMPSIAIARAKEGHTDFGQISLVFSKDTIDPKLLRSKQ